MTGELRRLHRYIWIAWLVVVAAAVAFCPHQNGPLGEGVVRDGYLECPWHGYQVDPCTGLGPPGFADSVPHYELVTKGNQTYLRAPQRRRL